jgi:uncharacterized protein YneR
MQENKFRLPKGTKVRFFLTVGKDRSAEPILGVILYYPKTLGVQTVINKERNISYFKTPTVIVKTQNEQTMRIDADAIDMSSPEALQRKFASTA